MTQFEETERTGYTTIRDNSGTALPLADEVGRLSALHRYKILDTPQEPAFDRIVSLAALLLDMPMALISLIDSDRQWFKAGVGVNVKETPRCIAFCDHAIRGAEIFEVPDARQDPRFAENALVTRDPFLRFYAGIPLITAEGYALGTLCVLDRAARHLNGRDVEILRQLAAQVMHELAVRTALGDLYEQIDRGRHVERTLRSSNLQLAMLLNATGNAVVATDANGNINIWNRAAEEMFGYTPDEIAGQPLALLLEDQSRDDEASYLLSEQSDNRDQMTTDGSLPASVRRELHGRHKSGRGFPIEVSLPRWTEKFEPAVFAAIIRDVTERRRVEDEQSRREATERERQKLVALGELAGGVAHELNNLLQPILSLVELARDRMQGDDVGSDDRAEMVEDFASVLEYTRQAREIVRKILLFARRDSPTLAELDFVNAVRSAVAFLRDLLPPAINLTTHISPAVTGVARINAVELTQLITNIAVNAVQAMAGRGTLTINLATADLPGSGAAAFGVAAGHHFILSIADTGCGMSDAVKARIFEPFFTTKPIGQGTGLGLSVAHGILRSWNGAISVESAPDRGTTFTLIIPRSPGESAPPFGEQHHGGNSAY